MLSSDLASTIERTGKMPIPHKARCPSHISRSIFCGGRHPACPHGARCELSLPVRDLTLQLRDCYPTVLIEVAWALQVALRGFLSNRVRLAGGAHRRTPSRTPPGGGGRSD